jgi:hypothetical protein
MKAATNLTNISTLVPIFSTFDLSKPVYSTSLRRLHKNLSKNETITEFFNGIDSPSGLKNSDLTDNQLDEPESSIKRKEFKKFPTYNYSTTRSSNISFNSNDKNAIIFQLSPEHLILIRIILILKYFCAKTKFKLAFKPYDFKDVIEQYTQGNMDILIKMKDLQRKMDNITTTSSFNRHFSNSNSDVFPQSDTFENCNNLSSSPLFKNLSNNNKQFFRQNSATTLKYQKIENHSRRVHNSASLSDSTNDTLNTQRLSKIESNINELTKKLDALLNLTINKNISFIDDEN